MYLTRMELDTARRKTIMALASPAMFHGAVERAFSEKGGKLWRLDTLAGKQYLLLLSESKPDLTDVVAQFGTQNGWETTCYDSFLSDIQPGECFEFCLKANPVIAKSTGTGHRGTIMAHVTATQQEQWLLERAEKYGFRLEPGKFAVVRSSREAFRKWKDGKKRVTFQAVTFEGVLTVTDVDLFRQTLKCGLGREKAYGCGLLTVRGSEARGFNRWSVEGTIPS